MKSLVFFLEELSARRMLEGVLPRLIPSDFNVQYVVFHGKSEALKGIEKENGI